MAGEGGQRHITDSRERLTVDRMFQEANPARKVQHPIDGGLAVGCRSHRVDQLRLLRIPLRLTREIFAGRLRNAKSIVRSRLKRKNPRILIYQMGKVGSMTLFEALSSRYRHVTHTHSHCEAAAVLSSRSNVKTIVFCGVREPICREISTFFENIDNNRIEKNLYAQKNDSQLHEYYFGDRCAIESSSIEELTKFFNASMKNHITKLVSGWFDSFQKVTGFKLADLNFDKTQGYSKVETEKLVIYFYQLENLDSFISSLVKTTDFKGIEFRKENLSNKKWHYKIQENFKLNYSINDKEYRKLLENITWINVFYDYYDLRRIASAYIKNL